MGGTLVQRPTGYGPRRDYRFWLVAILAAVVVASVEGLVAGGHDLTWNALVTPVAVFVLAAGLFLARRAH